MTRHPKAWGWNFVGGNQGQTRIRPCNDAADQGFCCNPFGPQHCRRALAEFQAFMANDRDALTNQAGRQFRDLGKRVAKARWNQSRNQH